MKDYYLRPSENIILSDSRQGQLRFGSTPVFFVLPGGFSLIFFKEFVILTKYFRYVSD